MINFKRLNSVLFVIFLGSSLSSIAGAQQATSTYQPPVTYQTGPVIQGQRIIQGQRAIQGQRFIQGQRVIRGQAIQGQPAQGQIIQGQPFIQGPVIQGRPIRGNIAQPQQVAPLGNQPQPAQQPQADAANRAKIAEQARTIKLLNEENSKLSRVQDTNNAMRKEYARLKRAYEDVSKELDELKINQVMDTAESADSDAQQAKLNQLNAQYQKTVEQNGTMAGQIELLTQENIEIKQRLKDLNVAGGDMSSLKADMNSANTTITQLRQNNETLVAENNRLQGIVQTATTNNEKLNMRLTNLSQENAQLQTEHQTATETNAALGQQVTELSTQNQDYLAAINSRPATPPPAQTNLVAERRDNRFVDERDQLLALNADLENENGLLMEQISELKADIGSLDKTVAPKASLLSAAVPAIPSNPVSKFNILNWLIPFLLIGLTIGLYVFLTEENGGEVVTGFSSKTLQTPNDTP